MSTSFSPNVEQVGVIVNRYLTVHAAAKNSGYNIQYLRRLLRDGNLRGVKIGQVWLIELDSYIEYIVEAVVRDDRRCGPRKDYISNTRAPR